MELAIASGVTDATKAYEFGLDLAGRGEAWKSAKVEIDGRLADAHKCEYAGAWAVEYIDPDIVVFAVGHGTLWPSILTLERVSLDELQNED